MNTEPNTPIDDSNVWIDAAPPFSWMPYQLTAIEVGETRNGFIGRSAAIRIDGVEVIIMTRHEHELLRVGNLLTDGKFDIEQIYKTTLIHTEGVEVIVPDETVHAMIQDIPPAEHVTTDPADGPHTEPGATPEGVPTIGGEPLARYVTPSADPVAATVMPQTTEEAKPAVADDDEL